MDITILVVDDEPDYLELMKGILEQEGYDKILTETNPLNVDSILKQNKIDLVILDIYMPQKNGIEVLDEIFQAYPHIPVIIVTAVDEVNIALKAVHLGAYEFIIKPPDVDRLLLSVRRALSYKLLEKERDTLRKTLHEPYHKNKAFDDIITDSSLMHKIFELVEIFAPTDETILIEGETGTGKDMIAGKIHELSTRRTKPFVAVNLASISSSLFESELFGHEKGSFTGATTERLGYFETANGGTIFLDEIGELPKELQGKLLRAIQYGEIFRIGSTTPVRLDIRIITATNKELIREVESGDFRADLYHRLNRGFIHLPPLRNRGNDVILLANYFLNAGNKKYNKNILGFSNIALELLKNYDFPGNVRELENMIFNGIVTTKSDSFINDFDIPKKILIKKYEKIQGDLLVTIDEIIKRHVIMITEYTDGDLNKAAAILGVSERTVQRRLKQIRES